MKKTRDELCEQIRDLSRPILDEKIFELVDVELVRSGRESVLRLFIDKQGGITLDDCADFSHELSLILDVEDIFPDNYTLEVSSPGLDRPLKKAEDFVRFTGRLIRVKTYEQFPDDTGNKRKTFLGTLDGYDGVAVRMKLKEGQTATIPLERIAKANLEFEF